ncbi:hypothetical protein CDD83_677 [Cordyceps sp. RAO-2017]|nr:hypothetical protein CDD83_677 [Cordyceps sp. RAO-2017]
MPRRAMPCAALHCAAPPPASPPPGPLPGLAGWVQAPVRKQCYEGRGRGAEDHRLSATISLPRIGAVADQKTGSLQTQDRPFQLPLGLIGPGRHCEDGPNELCPSSTKALVPVSPSTPSAFQASGRLKRLPELPEARTRRLACPWPRPEGVHDVDTPYGHFSTRHGIRDNSKDKGGGAGQETKPTTLAASRPANPDSADFTVGRCNFALQPSDDEPYDDAEMGRVARNGPLQAPVTCAQAAKHPQPPLYGYRDSCSYSCTAL